ncbi:MAG TPA: DNA polymerase, partial [Patescibacteria group bacterium]|nr:DNA polymerase [Patescibacteria group bacterium]
MALRSLYVDFDSYFASVEQQLRPELRGKPIGVVPVIAGTTCCIAASYEAKRFGVKTGTRVSDARKLCRGIQFVKARPAVYVEYHHKLVEAVELCIHVESVLSIDEMLCELTGSMKQYERATTIGRQIKETIANRVGTQLRCSIGIAPNPFLAKTASEMQKPNGFVVIDTPDLPHCLFSLNLRDLCGIGEAMERCLREHGINTVEDLCNASKYKLRKAWGGLEGERMYARLRGELVYTPPTRRATVGHSHVLPPELRSEEASFSVLNKLLQKAAMRLRSYGLVAGALLIRLKYIDGRSWDTKIGFDPTSDTLEFLHALSRLWAVRPKTKAGPLAVAVTLFNLSEEKSCSLSLFKNDRSCERLNALIDKLNLRYGKNTVYFGGAQIGLEAAPMRIAFTHIPDVTIESDE